MKWAELDFSLKNKTILSLISCQRGSIFTHFEHKTCFPNKKKRKSTDLRFSI